MQRSFFISSSCVHVCVHVYVCVSGCVHGQPLGSYAINISLIVETAITPDFILRKPWGGEQSTSPEPKPCSLQECVCVCESEGVREGEAEEEKERGHRGELKRSCWGQRGFFFSPSLPSVCCSGQSSLKWLCRVKALGTVAPRPFHCCRGTKKKKKGGRERKSLSLSFFLSLPVSLNNTTRTSFSSTSFLVSSQQWKGGWSRIWLSQRLSCAVSGLTGWWQYRSGLQ